MTALLKTLRWLLLPLELKPNSWSCLQSLTWSPCCLPDWPQSLPFSPAGPSFNSLSFISETCSDPNAFMISAHNASSAWSIFSALSPGLPSCLLLILASRSFSPRNPPWLSNLCFVVVVQSISCVWPFATLWTAGYQTPVSFTISQSLLKLKSIEWVMPSNHPLLGHPLLLPSIFPSIRVFSNESVLPIRWPKYWSFSFSISTSKKYSWLISFKIYWSMPYHQPFSSRHSSHYYGSFLGYCSVPIHPTRIQVP